MPNTRLGRMFEILEAIALAVLLGLATAATFLWGALSYVLTRLERHFEAFEENAIAVLLGLMTAVTFLQVVLRYVFNTGLGWELEATVFFFAWMVLLGISYLFKKSAHLGVDALLNVVSPTKRKLFGLLAAAACLLYAGLMFYAAFDYWWGFMTKNVWYEVNDIPMPAFLGFLDDLLNEGEPYGKLPRFIPYFALPLGFGLLLLRAVQATWRILTGEKTMLIASHEVEDAVAGLNAQHEGR